MRIVDNFELIYDTFPEPVEGEFYFVQILVRGKDGHRGEKGINGDNKNRLIKYYAFKTKQEILDKSQEIIDICKACNARAYIHPTKRSFKGVAKEMLRVVTEDFISENYEGLKGAFTTAAGRTFIKKDKKYIVDLDDDQVDMRDEILTYINTGCEPDDVDNKLVCTVPTLHGIHLITTPFNIEKFQSEYPLVAVQTNNPTLLYYRSYE